MKKKTKRTTAKLSPQLHFQIETKDELFGYVVNTTVHGAEAHCLHCRWSWSTEGSTLRGSFNAAERRAREHTTEAHPEKTRNVYTEPLCRCGHPHDDHGEAHGLTPCLRPHCPCAMFTPATVSSTRKETPQ